MLNTLRKYGVSQILSAWFHSLTPDLAYSRAQSYLYSGYACGQFSADDYQDMIGKVHSLYVYIKRQEQEQASEPEPEPELGIDPTPLYLSMPLRTRDRWMARCEIFATDIVYCECIHGFLDGHYHFITRDYLWSDAHDPDSAKVAGYTSWCFDNYTRELLRISDFFSHRTLKSAIESLA